MSLEQATFLRGLAQLTAAYPPRGGTDADQAALGLAWWRVLSAAEWLTGEVFAQAVQTTLEHVDDYLPTPATFLDICRLEKNEHDLAAQRETQRAALPATSRAASEDARSWFQRATPAQVWGVFDQHYLIGKARARKRAALVDAYRQTHGLAPTAGVPESVWRGQDEPTEAEIVALRDATLADRLRARRQVAAMTGGGERQRRVDSETGEILTATETEDGDDLPF